MPADYVPYGPEWEDEMMRMRKVDLVDMVRKACTKKENGSSPNTDSRAICAAPFDCPHKQQTPTKEL
jgi:hypothetical protein